MSWDIVHFTMHCGLGVWMVLLYLELRDAAE